MVGRVGGGGVFHPLCKSIIPSFILGLSHCWSSRIGRRCVCAYVYVCVRVCQRGPMKI